MGRLVRVGPYYIPPPVPHCGGSGDLIPFPYLLSQIPGTVAASDDALDALHLKYKVLFIINSQLSFTTQLWGKWRPYTLSVFAIANTRGFLPGHSG